MHKKMIATLITAILSGPTVAGEAEDEARGLVKQFGSTLKGQLVGAMKEGGPVKAIEFCNLRAPDIAAEIAAASNWEIGRTSLKIRSKDNEPDPWEWKVLQKFESQKAAGVSPQDLEYAEVVEVGGKQQFRYMKAIPTEKACLKCHAEKIAPDVDAKIQQLYPDDKARGFKEGDIRGAFSLSKPH